MVPILCICMGICMWKSQINLIYIAKNYNDIASVAVTISMLNVIL